ncbi:hypothetical protein CR513_39609, partial [Mucuna pruriens]
MEYECHNSKEPTPIINGFDTNLLLQQQTKILKYAKFLKELYTHKRKKLKGDVEIGRNDFALIKSEQFNIFEAMKHLIENHSIFCVDVIDVLVDDYIHSGPFAFFEFCDFADFANVVDFDDFEYTCDDDECSISVEIHVAIDASLELVEVAKIEVVENQPPLPSII